MQYIKYIFYILILILACLGFRELFPKRTVIHSTSIPVVITKYDTIIKLQLDTIFKTKSITDTQNIFTQVTRIDTVFFNSPINSQNPQFTRDSTEHFPIFAYQASDTFGGSGYILTKSDKNTSGYKSQFVTTGCLTSLYATGPTPQMTFTPFKITYIDHTSFIDKVKYISIGIGSVLLFDGIKHTVTK